MVENIYQKQKRELEEIRNESFKQGIWEGQKAEREKILEMIDKWIEKGFGLYNGNDFESLEELEKEVLKDAI